MNRAFLIAVLSGTLVGARPAPPVFVDGATAIVVGVDQPAAVMTAARDLAADMEKVFGRTPRIVQRREDAPGSAIVIASRNGGEPESFAIAASGAGVELTGSGMRGTIYAIYQFSED